MTITFLLVGDVCMERMAFEIFRSAKKAPNPAGHGNRMFNQLIKIVPFMTFGMEKSMQTSDTHRVLSMGVLTKPLYRGKLYL